MSHKTREMNSKGYAGHDQPCNSDAAACLRLKICDIVSNTDTINWSHIDDLLHQIPVTTSHAARCSTEDDPMGRLLMSKILAKNPPSGTLCAALCAFPHALKHNPAAFFAASRYASPETLAIMMERYVRDRCPLDKECPYPWILSEHVSVDGAKALLEIHPQGVLEHASLLSGLTPLDYFLTSKDMVEERKFDPALWNKFKLMLLAAEFCNKQIAGCCCISPVHMILKRVLGPDILRAHYYILDFFNNAQLAQHVLWLLHQLRWTDRWVFEKRADDGSCPLSFVLHQKCKVQGRGLAVARALVQILLEAHPASALHVFQGRLPLHFAIENGWPCHDLLLAAFPEALDIPDPKTELFPFQTAARAKETCSRCDLDITYELLRANPTHALQAARVMAQG